MWPGYALDKVSCLKADVMVTKLSEGIFFRGNVAKLFVMYNYLVLKVDCASVTLLLCSKIM